MIFPITFSYVYVKSLSVAIPREICANLDLDSIQYTSFMDSYNSGSRENSRSIKRGLFGSFWKNFSGSSKMVQLHWNCPPKKVAELTHYS